MMAIDRFAFYDTTAPLIIKLNGLLGRMTDAQRNAWERLLIERVLDLVGREHVSPTALAAYALLDSADRATPAGDPTAWSRLDIDYAYEGWRARYIDAARAAAVVAILHDQDRPARTLDGDAHGIHRGDTLRRAADPVLRAGVLAAAMCIPPLDGSVLEVEIAQDRGHDARRIVSSVALQRGGDPFAAEISELEQQIADGETLGVTA